jgi:hypothetical protein
MNEIAMYIYYIYGTCRQLLITVEKSGGDEVHSKKNHMGAIEDKSKCNTNKTRTHVRSMHIFKRTRLRIIINILIYSDSVLRTQ